MTRYHPRFASAWFIFFLASVACVSNAESPRKSNIQWIEIPNVSQFATSDISPIVTRLTGIMQDLEASHRSTSYGFVASGTFYREFSLDNKPDASLEHAVIHYLHEMGPERERWSVSSQDLLSNNAIREQQGAIISPAGAKQLVLSPGGNFISFGRGSMLIEPAALKNIDTAIRAFHPFRSAVCGSHQILAGGAKDVAQHSVLRKTIKKTCEIDGITHAWIELSGSGYTAYKVVSFRDNVPVQSAFFRPPSKGDPIKPYVLLQPLGKNAVVTHFRCL